MGQPIQSYWIDVEFGVTEYKCYETRIDVLKKHLFQIRRSVLKKINSLPGFLDDPFSIFRDALPAPDSGYNWDTNTLRVRYYYDAPPNITEDMFRKWYDLCGKGILATPQNLYHTSSYLGHITDVEAPVYMRRWVDKDFDPSLLGRTPDYDGSYFHEDYDQGLRFYIANIRTWEGKTYELGLSLAENPEPPNENHIKIHRSKLVLELVKNILNYN